MMANIDQVKYDIERCISHVPDACRDCSHYWNKKDGDFTDINCMEKLLAEAYDLLKKQDAEWIEYPECLAYDGAYSDSHIVCSACKHVFSTMDNCTEEFDYCPHCGAKMKQESR